MGTTTGLVFLKGRICFVLGMIAQLLLLVIVAVQEENHQSVNGFQPICAYSC